MFGYERMPTPFTEGVIDSVEEIKNAEGSEDNFVFLSVLRAILPPDTKLEILNNPLLWCEGFENKLDRTTSDKLVIFGVNDYVFNNLPVGYKNWKRVDKITDYYKKEFNVVCYLNENLKSTIYIINAEEVDRNSYYITTRLTQSIPVAMPWFFKTKESMSGTTLKLLKSLDNSTENEFLSILREIANSKYDYASLSLRKSLDGFDNIILTESIKKHKEEAEQLRRDIDAYHSLAAARAVELRDKSEILQGLKMILQSTEKNNKTLEFFLNSDCVDFVTVNNGNLTFIVRTYLSLWDEAEERYIDDPQWSFYTQELWSEKKHALAKAVFQDKVIKIRTCAAFEITVRTCGATNPAKSNYAFSDAYHTYFPNPHLQGFACMEAWRSDIEEALLRNDTPYAIEICKAAAESLTLSDTTVMRYMAEQIKGKEVFELPSGEIVDYEKAGNFALEFYDKKEDEHE